MFTKQHYKSIAGILEKQLNPITFSVDDCCVFTVKKIIKDLEDYFADDNPNFDREKFLKACGLGE